MDVEKLIERLNQYSQSLIAYKLGADFADACVDAVSTLFVFQSENEKLRAELDAAIKQLHGNCNACAYYTSSHNQGPCSECKYEYYLYPCDAMKDNWEWCGPQEED